MNWWRHAFHRLPIHLKSKHIIQKMCLLWATKFSFQRRMGIFQHFDIWLKYAMTVLCLQSLLQWFCTQISKQTSLEVKILERVLVRSIMHSAEMNFYRLIWTVNSSLKGSTIWQGMNLWLGKSLGFSGICRACIEHVLKHDALVNTGTHGYTQVYMIYIDIVRLLKYGLLNNGNTRPSTITGLD